uniref:Ionotropic glutamate receptor L-glutamate and glycine-binding domain-containing protein n=1 Tax=Anopheles coluzzii TaxID=1518534 RepID=A0A6E8WC96_ANOCL
MNLRAEFLTSVFLLQAVASLANSTSSLIPFVADAFERSIRTLYLVDLARWSVFDQLQKLPFPKVLFDGNRSIGKLDQSRLVLMYANLTDVSALQDSFLTTFHDLPATSPWNARVVALVEDQYLEDGGMFALLRTLFKHCGISYWSVTSVQGGSYLLYSLDYGNTSITVKAQLNFEQTYTYRRMFINHQLLIHVQALISFPYTFDNRRAALDGIDVVLFSHLFYYLRWDWQEVKVTGASAKEMLYVSIDRLLSGTVDLTITRRIADAPFLPTIAVSELIRFCLVVPRKSSMEFFNNLFQPFSTDLWTLIGCVSVLLYGVKLLGEGDTKVGTLLRTLTHASPLHRFVQIALSFCEFILIECYLARVTSLLLVHRFQPEPETLAQFFATDIPMHMLSSHLAFVHQLAPDVTAAILARAVLVDGLDRTSHTHAYLDSVDRATYTIAVLQSTDPTSGRKASYILPETVSSFPAAYMVARTAAPLRDCLALHLDWMRAFGFRRLMDRLFDNLLEADVRRVVIIEDLVQIEHVVPLLIFLSFGWVISGAVFVGERMLYSTQQTVRAIAYRQRRKFTPKCMQFA